ncbi:hypothetical protein VNI00_015044 [Paramarasmius palmivorus]|uniref:MYND-type domain-containing protein n=1 Tax=Paramarasmius palmivorus TaxID=297713 RepID=A0AAW0BQZ7_9AGAR
MSTITKLRRCSKCTLATYCGGECQKAHWREHKAECKILATEREKAMSLGLGERYESLEKWRRHRANSLLGPVSWALDVGLDTDKSGTHIFLVKLVITEASENRRNPWRLESARIVPHHLLSQTYGYDIEPQTDIVRILFVDEALSRHFLLHWEMRVDAEAEGKLRRLVLKEDECDWIDWTSNLVQYGVHRPDRPPEIDSYLYPKGTTRQESMKRFLRFHMWVDEVWEVLLGAADSALELQTSPERLETHRLVVFADLLVQKQRYT